MVIGALLSNEVSLSELADLEPKHFYLPLHSWIIERCVHCAAAGLTPSVDLICGVAGDFGIAPDFLRPELMELTSLPWVSPAAARDAAVLIVELADARELADRLTRAVVCLKSRTHSAAQVRARLRQIVSE